MSLNTGTENKHIQAYEDVPQSFRHVLMNALPEVIVIGERKHNFIIKNLRLAGGGSFNTVFSIDVYKNGDMLQQKYVLRIHNQNLAHQDEKRQNLLNDIRKLFKMFEGSGLVRLPIFSSIDVNHECGSVIWQVLPSMDHLPTTLNLNQTRNYINVIYGVLKRLHANYLIYIDWKRDNAMCSGDDIRLTDTEFLSAYGGMENLLITQCMPKYFKEKLSKYKLNQFQNISTELMILDNHIGIREMVLALISMTGYFEGEANYDELIEERWYEDPVDIGNQDYNKIITSICSILNKDWTTDDECLDFVFKYINEFLDIVENEGSGRSVDELIARNQQQYFALSSNRTPESSPSYNNMELNTPPPFDFSPKKRPMTPCGWDRKVVQSEEEETIEMDELNFDE